MIENYVDVDIIILNNPGIFDDLADPEWFEQWYRKNMPVLLEFQRWAYVLKWEGKRKRYAARAVWQRMRWETLFTEADPLYKLNNNATPYLARLIAAADPALDGLFKVRRGPHKTHTPICYQCELPVGYLFDDGRCWECTRLTPEEVTGETI